ncbi:YdcF family protein [Paramicrobacterium fandaimingii]|uniref:YdcF family protein n=1 Tax=Paramicrobacterium fandaimingii TaxID=2708079 RepID=UPI00141F587C|nr:YdcF family protein [Microbacterium fandaimingii]
MTSLQSMESVGTAIPGFVDARAGEIRSADVIFVFGTRYWSPAEVAASLYLKGMAPKIVLTGGPSRHPRGLAESRIHYDLLRTAAVPGDDILSEETSRHTGENVAHALPLLNQLGSIRSVIAVVKWFHRRALITLAQQIPSLERIYAADYEPFDLDSRSTLSRSTWQTSCLERVDRETQYLRSLRDEGTDLLTRTNSGWTRTQD